MANLEIPVNPAVVKWAIDESGYSTAEIAKTLRVDASKVHAWRVGDGQPTKGQLNGLARKLRRSPLVFLLQRVPLDSSLGPEFRSVLRPDGTSLELSPPERLAIRRARYLQQKLSELVFQDERPKVEIPRHELTDEPEAVGKSIRSWVAGDCASEESIGREFAEWRQMAEAKRIFVMLPQLSRPRGSDKSQELFKLRGFSLPDDYAPVVAVISADYPPARSFTLFHELAHLTIREYNSCHVPSFRSKGVEQWCDRVAGSALIPRDDLKDFIDRRRESDEQERVKRVASHYKTSLRAAAVAIENAFPSARGIYLRTDKRLPLRDRPKDGGGNADNSRPAKRVREYGALAVRTFLQAFADRRIDELDSREYLRLFGPETDRAAALIEVHAFNG